MPFFIYFPFANNILMLSNKFMRYKISTSYQLIVYPNDYLSYLFVKKHLPSSRLWMFQFWSLAYECLRNAYVAIQFGFNSSANAIATI